METFHHYGSLLTFRQDPEMWFFITGVCSLPSLVENDVSFLPISLTSTLISHRFSEGRTLGLLKNKLQ